MVVFADMESSRYDIDGRFIDPEPLGNAKLNSSRYNCIILAAERILGEGDLTEDRTHEFWPLCSVPARSGQMKTLHGSPQRSMSRGFPTSNWASTPKQSRSMRRRWP